MIKVVQGGDLLQATEQYIAHQSNCISTKSHGLSKKIALAFPHADAYSFRKSISGRNLAIESDRPDPGTIQVYGDGSADRRHVISMFAQYAMGKPFTYSNSSRQWNDDDYAHRAEWFKSCLKRIGDLRASSVAFPYYIGCDLAGGDWSVYLQALSDFAAQHPETSVVLYKLNERKNV